LDRLGLSKAIEALVRSASRATGIHFSTDIFDIDQSFPEELRINFYRIVQEAVNNIIKHSGASEASIRVEKTGSRFCSRLRTTEKASRRSKRALSPEREGLDW
jgi:signal transduction histidine kinase